MRKFQRQLSALLLTAFAVFFASPAESSPKSAGPSGRPHRIRLDNGMVVRLAHYSIFPVTAVAMTYRAGSNQDPVGLKGLAHLVEHILFRGTPEHRPDQELERIGASFNAETVGDRTIYYETFQSRDLSRVLELEADRMSNVAVTATLVDLEKQVIREEGQAIAEHVRPSDVQQFYRQHYRPGNASLVVVSDLSQTDLIRGIEKAFGSTARFESVESPDAGESRLTGPMSLSDEIDIETPTKMALALARSASFNEPDNATWGASSTRKTGRRLAARFVRRVLPNGMRVLLYSHPDYRTISVQGYVPAGLHYDRDQPGLASLTAYVMTDLASRPGSSSEQPARFNAVSFNTYIEARALPEALPTVVQKVAMTLTVPKIAESDVVKARERMIQDLERRGRAPAFRAFVAASQRFYASPHALRMSSAEELIASVRTIDASDVRAFHRSHYRPDQAILVIVGNLSVSHALQVVENAFKHWKATGSREPVDLPRMSATADPGEVHLRNESGRAYILLAHPGSLRRRDADYYASIVANSVLGASVLSSRLGLELRGRTATVYDVRSEFFEATLADGLWGVVLDTSAERASAAIAAAKEVIRDFVSSGVSRHEFEHHRSAVKGSFAVSLSIPLALAGRILDAEFFGLGKEYLRAFERELDRLTPESVNNAARKHLHPPGLFTVRVSR